MPTLYVVATPIGNLSDLAPRAAETLRAADLILAEDTRVTRKLLSHLDIHAPMQSNHRHNEREQAEHLARRMLEEDLTVALVSDAGTPGVSDPGAALVAEAAAAGIPVVPIAGPSAVAAALSISGFEGAGYAFHGFPPRADGERKRFLSALAGESQRIVVLFESPHRIADLTRAFVDTLPEAQLCLCCDLTKRYELTLRGTPQQIHAALLANPNSDKGEYVLVADLRACVPPPAEKPVLSPRAALCELLMDGLSMKESIARAVEMGIPRNEAYKASLDVKSFFASAYEKNTK
jgi:16S rRNA (cytidine1402-2'-O)-methyltransferase